MELINSLLKVLSPKEADVLRRRFGLNDTGKETLETIGNAYNVTRERIRQIESQSIKKIQDSDKFAESIGPVEHLIISIITHHGGIMSKKMMLQMLTGENEPSKQDQQAIQFILGKLLKDKIDEVSKSKTYLPSWKLHLTSLTFVESVLTEIVGLIKRLASPQTFEFIYEAFQETELYQKNSEKLTEDIVLSFMDVSVEIGKNPFDEFGLAKWGQIQPRRMNDRVYLILKKAEKPMHFEDIAQQISKVFKKRAYPPTVHNELILNDEYVLVGRGIYALKEWGFKEGIVSAVIQEIMRKNGAPMKRSEIVAEVLKQRIVKKNTIHLALTDKMAFKKHSDGKYTLSEGAEKKDAVPEN